jgi:hypothetical protein
MCCCCFKLRSTGLWTLITRKCIRPGSKSDRRRWTFSKRAGEELGDIVDGRIFEHERFCINRCAEEWQQNDN